MTTSIYRKYRPSVFADVVGQDHVTRTLQQEIMTGKLAHAYLFCGMRGVGKTTVARLLAKAVNCEKRSTKISEPCNGCESCNAISSGRSLDLIEIDAASNRRIDDVREIREHIPYGPTQAKYKVVIVDEVHMLTTEAFNALLKTLEEPPPHVLFVLCTTEPHKIPETIISRCQRFDFLRLSSSVLLERLRGIAKAEGIKIDDNVLFQIIELSGGSSRDAEGYLGKLLSLGEKNVGPEQAVLVLPKADLATALAFVRALVQRHAENALIILNDIANQGGDVAYFYRQVLNLLRQMLLLKIGGKNFGELSVELVPEVLEQVREISTELTQSRLNGMIERWLKIEGSWRFTEIWQLPLELAAVEIAQGGEQEPPAANGGRAPEAKKGPVGEAKPTSSGALSLEAVLAKWPNLVSDLREYNHSLSFILSVAEPVKLEGNTLTVGFTYELHLARVNDPKVATIIEQALQRVFAWPLKLKGQALATPAGEQNLLDNVLSTFGGSVQG